MTGQYLTNPDIGVFDAKLYSNSKNYIPCKSGYEWQVNNSMVMCGPIQCDSGLQVSNNKCIQCPAGRYKEKRSSLPCDVCDYKADMKG